MAFHAPTYEDIVNSKYATAMPAPAVLPQTDTRNYFQAVDNLIKVYAIRPTDKVLFLTDPLLDRRIVDAISGIANARDGAARSAGGEGGEPVRRSGGALGELRRMSRRRRR